ncbi:hypothetical protein [Mesorhizobium sp. WSM3224]|uniref:hypothetical protein n=1 Tax=Mesorhizobium sp. WSM3224 TaxID=1040986 RepID=UPI0004891FC1|nr:hypothetical protein [Mesorhizobium sp. WSM3224]
MRGLTVYKDHVIHHNGLEGNQPPIEGLSLTTFASIALRWNKSKDYLLRTHAMTLRKTTDYDGFPFEDFYEIRYGVKDHYHASDDPSIRVTFNDTREAEYDYVAMASRDTTTAYKRGRSGTPQETRFKIHSASIGRQEGDADVWAKGEAVRLTAILDGLDQAMHTLRSWAESGVNMRVLCPTWACRWDAKQAIISSDRLLAYADKGLSLDDFKLKLRCRVCGAACSDIRAA